MYLRATARRTKGGELVRYLQLERGAGADGSIALGPAVNEERLHEELGDLPPAEYEELKYQNRQHSSLTAR